MSKSKVLILTGAPLGETLDWASPALLQNFTTPIARFVRDSDTAASSPSSPSPPAASAGPDFAVWRSLPLERKHLPTGFSQQHGAFLAADSSRNNDEHTEFFTTAGVPFDGSALESSTESHGGDGDDVISQFCQHTLAALDGNTTSSVSQMEVSFSSTQDGMTTTSFASTTSGSGGADEHESFVVRDPVPVPHNSTAAPLSDLQDIPNASYLTSIEPRTMTVNLVVGVISIAAPRTVKTRWGATRSLVELLVGDDTRSGFGVTFWLSGPGLPDQPPAAKAGAGAGVVTAEGDAEHVLARLRPQDVILLRNVGLGSFMRKVYGFGLYRGITKVHLLYRRKLDVSDEEGHYRAADLISSKATHPQVLKARRTREWVMRFVGTGHAPEETVAGGKRKFGKGGGGGGGGGVDQIATVRRWDMPPPIDTQ